MMNKKILAKDRRMKYQLDEDWNDKREGNGENLVGWAFHGC